MSLAKNRKYDVIKVTVSIFIPRTGRFNKKEKPANIAFHKDPCHLSPHC